MNAKENAKKLVMSIYNYAEMNSYEDNGMDDRLDNAKDAANEVIDNVIIPRLDYIFTNDADLLTETKYWNAVKAEIYNVQPKNDMQCGVGKNNI